MITDIFALSNDVRYVAIYRDGHLETKLKEDIIDAAVQIRIDMKNF
jgi:hypothetical protein